MLVAMGKRRQILALKALVAPSESVVWTGILIQTTLLSEVRLKFKVRALLTQNALIWSSLRDLDHPIRIEYLEMLDPQITLTGIVGHYSFSIPADESRQSGEEGENFLGILFGGVPAAFIDYLVSRLPDIQLLSPALQQRYL